MKLKVSLRFVLSLLILCGNWTASAQLRLDSIWNALNESAATPPPRPQLKARSNGNFGPAFYSMGKVFYDSLFLFALHEQFGHKKGTDAAAHLLAHELAHFTHRHADTYLKRLAFGEMASEMGISPDADRMKVLLAKEKDADLYGGMNSTQAGFGSLKVAPDLLRFVYSYYKLPDSIEGYPSIQNRIQIGENIAKQVLLIDEAYRLALATCLLGHPVAARRILHSIVYDGNFRSAEVLHLTSFTLFKEATLMTPSPIVRQWIWPIDFDHGAHKTSLSRGGIDTKAIDLLAEAKELEKNSLALRREERSKLLESIEWLMNHLTTPEQPYAVTNMNLLALELALGGSFDKAKSTLSELDQEHPNLRILNHEQSETIQKEDSRSGIDLFHLRFSGKRQSLRINSNTIASYWQAEDQTLFEVKEPGNRDIAILNEPSKHTGALSQPVTDTGKVLFDGQSVYFIYPNKQIRYFIP